LRALISGGTGFVGVHLCEFLLTRGDEVAVFSKDKPFRIPPEVRCSYCDIRDPDEVRTIFLDFRPDAVYHLAAISRLGTARQNPRLAFEVNVLGTYNVFEAASRLPNPVRLLNVSTAQVYRQDGSTIDEDSAVSPANAYAASKAMAEWVPRLCVDSAAVDYVTVRPFNHSGPGQTDDFVLSSFARQIADMEAGTRSCVLAVGDLDVERDFLDVRDVVRAYRLLIERGHRGEVYNLSSGRTYRISEIVDMFRRLSSVAFEVRVDPGRVRKQQPLRSDCSPAKLTADTGFQATIPLETTLHDLLDYWRTALRTSSAVG
jgi:GDP-4-dehydro-6-deoxy-D-mannose reductase